MKSRTLCLLLNIALMIFTAWLIWYFDNGWWILLFIFGYYTVEEDGEEDEK